MSADIHKGTDITMTKDGNLTNATEGDSSPCSSICNDATASNGDIASSVTPSEARVRLHVISGNVIGIIQARETISYLLFSFLLRPNENLKSQMSPIEEC